MNRVRDLGRLAKVPFFIVGGVILAAGLALLFGLVVRLLWNWLMPAIFGLPEIRYWQAWGLVLLAHILFKSGGHSSHEKHHPGPSGRDRDWRERFRRKVDEHLGREKGTRREGVEEGTGPSGGETETESPGEGDGEDRQPKEEEDRPR